MSSEAGKTISIWMDTQSRPGYPVLNASLNCDVCIVGAGITGLSCAYLLLKEGKSVIVLDDGKVVSGDTQRTTAHITNVVDDRYFEIEHLHGLETARLVKESQTAAIEKIESIVRTEKIDCDFVRLNGYLFLAEGSSPPDVLSKELDACRRVGFTDVELLQELPVFTNKPPALSYPNQAQFHILKYLSGLCNAVTQNKGQIFQDTHVTSVKKTTAVQVQTSSGNTIEASAVIVATNSPVTDFVAVHTKQAPYRTFAIGLKVPKGSIASGLYWDTLEPYHYIRLQDIDDDKDSQLLIVGGEDHRTGQKNDADERFVRLEEWARHMFSIASPVLYRWSGQVYEPVDGLSFIGQDPAAGENVYVATGDSGMGMTHGTMSAIILTDLIMGRENKWAEIYKPTRKSVRALPEYLSENASSFAQYEHLLGPAEVKDQSEIPPGHGAILNRGLKKFAAYRDESGQLLELSAYCTHLKGVVCWNSCEQSWDCPVHGSRFSATGEVINAPANIDLPPHS